MLGMSFQAVIQMFEFIIPHGSEGRADKVLANAFPETSRTLIKRKRLKMAMFAVRMDQTLSLKPSYLLAKFFMLT